MINFIKEYLICKYLYYSFKHKQSKCKHTFDMDDLKYTKIQEPNKPESKDYNEWSDYYSTMYTHSYHTKRVQWMCSKCNKIFYAHCGLDILKYGKAFRKEK